MNDTSIYLTPRLLKRAEIYRAAGVPWTVISSSLGASIDAIRRRIDRDYLGRQRVKSARRNADIGQHHSNIRVMQARPSEAAIRQALAAIPPDTRSLTARAFGDPLPGRSALDRRSQVTT